MSLLHGKLPFVIRPWPATTDINEPPVVVIVVDINI